MRGWRRWLPLATTFVIVGLCLAEIVSGSHAPDPVIPLWFASMAWVAAFSHWRQASGGQCVGHCGRSAPQ